MTETISDERLEEYIQTLTIIRDEVSPLTSAALNDEAIFTLTELVTTIGELSDLIETFETIVGRGQ